jgi:hypothetical protein
MYSYPATIQFQGGNYQFQDPIVFNNPIFLKGAFAQWTLGNRANPADQASAGFGYNTGGETFFGTNNSTSVILGLSSFNGLQAPANGASLGGRGSFWWNGGFAGLRLEYAEKTANYSIVATDSTVNVTANSPTITLPDSVITNATISNYANAAAGVAGKVYTVKNSGAGTATVATFSNTRGTGVTNGTTTITFASNGQSVTPGEGVSGTNIPAGAYIVSGNTTSAVISAAATGSGSGATFTFVEPVNGAPPAISLTTGQAAKLQSTGTGWITIP